MLLTLGGPPLSEPLPGEHAHGGPTVGTWPHTPCTREPHTEDLFSAGVSETLQREASRNAPTAQCTALGLSANSTRCLTQKVAAWAKPPWLVLTTPLAGGQERGCVPTAKACTVLTQLFPSHSNPTLPFPTGRRGQDAHIWPGVGRPWLRGSPAWSYTSLGGTQTHSASRRRYGPHCLHPQAVLAVSSLKRQAADQLPRASPWVHPESQEHRGRQVSQTGNVQGEKSVKNAEHICDLHNP